jgi:hypothetical protein
MQYAICNMQHATCKMQILHYNKLLILIIAADSNNVKSLIVKAQVINLLIFLSMIHQQRKRDYPYLASILAKSYIYRALPSGAALHCNHI